MGLIVVGDELNWGGFEGVGGELFYLRDDGTLLNALYPGVSSQPPSTSYLAVTGVFRVTRNIQTYARVIPIRTATTASDVWMEPFTA